MKKIFFLLFLTPLLLHAQYKVKGEIRSAKEITWAYLYKIEGAKQYFVKNSVFDLKEIASKNSTTKHVEFELPNDTEIGSYRVLYKNDGTGFVDFLFNKEDVSFSFDAANPNTTLSFNVSAENILYQKYIAAIYQLQGNTDSLQVAYLNSPSEKTAVLYKAELKKIESAQQYYTQQSTGMLINHYISAAKKYNTPSIAKTPNEYLSAIKEHFFDAIDLNSNVLYNSAFLIDRITDYVYYLNYSDDPKTQEKLYLEAVNTILKKITKVAFKKDVLEYLISQFINQKETATADYLLNITYQKLPKETQDKKFVKEALEKMAVNIGRIAPDISWEENGKSYSLSTLNEANNYVLVFWSTGCSHCLKEIPELHTFTKSKTNTKVIAFSLEAHDVDWKNYKKGLQGWYHILGLEKWENEIARTYQIYSTPTYIVLDSDKKIIAKPETIEELKKIIDYLDK